MTTKEIIIHKTILKECVKFWLMTKDGSAHAMACIFNDQKDRLIMSELSVDPMFRKNGIGLLMQQVREEIGIKEGCTDSFLWVELATWQKDWYKRRGYKYHSRLEGKRAQWLKKPLIQ
jgi:N-acetylglutamate synthase-like GNAT family acetyltransferase